MHPQPVDERSEQAKTGQPTGSQGEHARPSAVADVGCQLWPLGSFGQASKIAIRLAAARRLGKNGQESPTLGERMTLGNGVPRRAAVFHPCLPRRDRRPASPQGGAPPNCCPSFEARPPCQDTHKP